MGKRASKGDGRLGNQFWKLRSRHGRGKIFATADLMWEAACEYFQWCDDNPLSEDRLFAFKGSITKDKVDIIRAYTLSGLCIYLGCNEAYFRNFKNQERNHKEDFSSVIGQIEQVIETQQFTAAAAGLLNANIIARKLGLTDKKETELKGELKVNQVTGIVVK